MDLVIFVQKSIFRQIKAIYNNYDTGSLNRNNPVSSYRPIFHGLKRTSSFPFIQRTAKNITIMKQLSIIVLLFIIVGCSFNNKPHKKKSDELALFIFIDEENKEKDVHLRLLYEDSIIYDGIFRKKHKTTLPDNMFITNLPKGTKLNSK